MPGETTIVARGTVSHTLRHDATNKTGCAASGGMLGVLYACMGLIFLPIFALAALAGALAQQTQQAQNTGGPPSALITAMTFGFAIFMPVFYGVLGFMFCVISPAIYHLIARWLCGIDVEVQSLIG